MHRHGPCIIRLWWILYPILCIPPGRKFIYQKWNINFYVIFFSIQGKHFHVKLLC